MSSGIKARLEDLKERFQRLSSRERVAVGAMAATLAVVVVGGLIFWVFAEVSALELRNTAIRQALSDIQRYGPQYLQYQKRQDALRHALSAPPLDLTTHVDQVASAVGIKIDVTTAAKPFEGAKYRREGVRLALRKINLAQLASLMERMSASASQLIQVRQLDVRQRWGEQEGLDVEMEVCTFSKRKKGKKRARKRRRG